MRDLAKPISSLRLWVQRMWLYKNQWSCGSGVTVKMPTPRSCSCFFLLLFALELPLFLSSTGQDLRYIPATSFAFTSAVNRSWHCAETLGTELLPVRKMCFIHPLHFLRNFVWKMFSGFFPQKCLRRNLC